METEARIPEPDWAEINPVQGAITLARVGLAVFPTAKVVQRCSCGDQACRRFAGESEPDHQMVEACSCFRGGDCGKPGKHPAIKGWQEAATTTPAQISRWARELGTIGFGIATGERSGWDVVDVDPRHGGTESLNRLMRDVDAGMLEVWATNPRVATPSGGWHLYVPHRPGRSNIVGQSADAFPGIDLRTTGGLVVCPPGTKERPYRVEQWFSGRDARDLPEAIEAIFQATNRHHRIIAPGRTANVEPTPPPNTAPGEHVITLRAGTDIRAWAKELGANWEHRVDRYAEATLAAVAKRCKAAQPGHHNETAYTEATSLYQLAGLGVLNPNRIEAATFGALTCDKHKADEVRATLASAEAFASAVPRREIHRAAGAKRRNSMLAELAVAAARANLAGALGALDTELASEVAERIVETVTPTADPAAAAHSASTAFEEQLIALSEYAVAKAAAGEATPGGAAALVVDEIRGAAPEASDLAERAAALVARAPVGGALDEAVLDRVASLWPQLQDRRTGRLDPAMVGTHDALRRDAYWAFGAEPPAEQLTEVAAAVTALSALSEETRRALLGRIAERYPHLATHLEGLEEIAGPTDPAEEAPDPKTLAALLGRADAEARRAEETRVQRRAADVPDPVAAEDDIPAEVVGEGSVPLPPPPEGFAILRPDDGHTQETAPSFDGPGGPEADESLPSLVGAGTGRPGASPPGAGTPTRYTPEVLAALNKGATPMETASAHIELKVLAAGAVALARNAGATTEGEWHRLAHPAAVAMVTAAEEAAPGFVDAVASTLPADLQTLYPDHREWVEDAVARLAIRQRNSQSLEPSRAVSAAAAAYGLEVSLDPVVPADLAPDTWRPVPQIKGTVEAERGMSADEMQAALRVMRTGQGREQQEAGRALISAALAQTRRQLAHEHHHGVPREDPATVVLDGLAQFVDDDSAKFATVLSRLVRWRSLDEAAKAVDAGITLPHVSETRSDGSRSASLEQVAPPAPSAEEEAEANEQTRKLAQALNVCSERERQVIELHYGIGSGEALPITAVAEQLGMSPAQAQQLLQRGVSRMSVALRAEASDESEVPAPGKPAPGVERGQHKGRSLS